MTFLDQVIILQAYSTEFLGNYFFKGENLRGEVINFSERVFVLHLNEPFFLFKISSNLQTPGVIHKRDRRCHCLSGRVNYFYIMKNI